MSGSFVSIGTHFIFSTKDRQPFITDDISERIYSYIGGIINSLDGIPIIINGTSDHIHIYCFLPKEISVSRFIRIVKSRSSKWIHNTFPAKYRFKWQDGYGAFSVSKSIEDRVIEYIKNQKEHHKDKSFKEEFLAILKKLNIEYNEKYIWV